MRRRARCAPYARAESGSAYQLFGNRLCTGCSPLIQPSVESRAKISGALGEETFGQIGSGPLQIVLADFKDGEQSLTFPLPGTLSIVPVQPFSQESKIMRSA